MTELQKTEFEILRTFTDICDRLELPYFLVCGTALGAAKYGGFIPWDDDVDVAMPRKSYEIFLEKAPSLMPAHLFLQNYKTDPAFPAIYSKLRNSNTTYIEKSAAHLPIHHGVYIDIFPLDGYPRGKWSQQLLELGKMNFSLQVASAYRMDCRWTGRIAMGLLRTLGCHRRTEKTIARYSRMIQKWDFEDSDLICNHGNWQRQKEYAPRSQYGQGFWTTFEGLKVRIPEDYDGYLTQKYGAWRQDPPREQQTGHHYYEVCDTEKPYTEYQSKGGKS